MSYLIFMVMCILHSQFTSCFCISLGFEVKLEFLSNFITANSGKCDLHLNSWSVNEQLALFKRSKGFLKVNSGRAAVSEQTVRVYDFMSASNGSSVSVTIPPDHSQKLLLIDIDTNIDLLLKGVDILPGRNIKLARFINANGNYMVKISRSYRLVQGQNARIIEDYLLTWRPGNSIDLRLERMARKRVSFNGMTLPVAIVLSSRNSLQRLEDFRDQWTDTFTKANYAPIMKMCWYFNITPEFKVVSDYEHLERSDVDKYIFTVTAPYMTKHLLQHIDFLKVTPPTKVGFTLRRPPTSFMTTIFTVTFSPGVWYATLGLLALLSGALYAFLNFEARRHDIKGQTSFGVYDLMLIGLEAICQQGTSTNPRSYASRILQVFMFMAFMFLYVAYSANILVLLQSTTALSTRHQLWQYGVEYAGLNTSSFNYYRQETADIIYKKHPVAPMLLSVQEGMERVRNGIFAFYMESRYADMYAREYFSDYEVCGMQELEVRYDFGLGYAAIAKSSGYTEMFKIALLQIAEQGFASRHYLRYFLKPACYSQGSSFDTIGIRETYQAMLLVVMGVIAGLLVLALEICLFRVRKQ